MMKTPTAKYRLDIVLALTNFFDRPECNEISLVQYGDPVSYPARPMHIVCHDDQSRATLSLAMHQKFIDFRGRDAVKPAARFIGEKDLRLEHQCSGETGPLPHAP